MKINTIKAVNNNTGIVPPWLAEAIQDNLSWKHETEDPSYEPGGSPFDYGLSTDDVANHKEEAYFNAHRGN